MDSNPAAEERWHRWGSQHGLDTHDWFPRFRGIRPADLIAGVAPHLDAAAENRALDLERSQDAAQTPPIGGASNLLRSLHADAWAVVTSSPGNIARERMQGAGLPQPAVLVAGEDVHDGKPSPEGYLLASTRLHCEPGACAVVEDSAEGIKAGLCSGMLVVHLSSPEEPPISDNRAHITISHLADLRFALQQLGCTTDAFAY